MTDAPHSATPWDLCHHLESAEKDASCKCGYRGGIWGDAGEILVCEMRNCDLHEGHEMTPVGDRATQLANAQFIVKACNSYDAMLDALKTVNKLISEAAMTGFNCKDGDWADRLFHSQQKTSAAIKKATVLPSQEGKTS